ncbi:MAG: alpha/beta hydrolase [Candidatus Solibacter usitatus]|nr:alpha/beta hydrolase [Candidatus Solibacter usitatus]
MIFLALSLIAILLAGVVYQAVGTALDKRRYPPPGRIVEGMHLRVEGAGDPTVVLEAGIAATSLSWSRVQPEVAKFARVLSYDRAGLGWSGPASGPRTVDRLVAELRQLLAGAGLPGPYVLVGHSFGGLVARAFAARYPDEVAGLVLVDPVHPREWWPVGAAQRAMLERGIKLSRRGALLARIGVVRFALAMLMAGQRAVPRLLARVSSGRGVHFTERIVGEVRKLPPEVWPAVRAHWCRPERFEAMAGYLEALPESARDCAEPPPTRIPCIVLAADNANELRRREYEREASLSPKGRFQVVPNSGHWIMLDSPEVVVRAIRTILEASQA